jgi:hypothetical protein
MDEGPFQSPVAQRRRPYFTGLRTLAGMLNDPPEALALYRCGGYLLEQKRAAQWRKRADEEGLR